MAVERKTQADSVPTPATTDPPTPWARIMTDDEYYPFLVKKNLRPGIWRWREVAPRLQGLAADPLRRADRRFVTLVNEDTGEAGGMVPTVFIGIQIINPGEHILPHRHNSFAIYHIVQGRGYSVLNGQRFDWVRGDTFLCPPMASHEHFALGDEQTIQYVVQDMPARAMERNLIWEEPIGHSFHMVEGNVPQSE